MKKIALFTMAVGKDPIYFESVGRYFPYNKKYFRQDNTVDFYVFTDREGQVNEEVTSLPCKTTVWPYTTLLKNNTIHDYMSEQNKWNEYDYIFFIDADFAIGDYYNFFDHDFILVRPYWNEINGGGFFYGGKTEYFRLLCDSFYEELNYIVENKLPLPRDIDEFYLGIFLKQHRDIIHMVEMSKENTLIFYDNENLDNKVKQYGNKLFMQPYKSTGRANKTMVIDSQYKEQECIVNLEEEYIFNNYTFDFGRLLKIDDSYYRIFWSDKPAKREVLDIKNLQIYKDKPSRIDKPSVPAISVVMPVYNANPEFLVEAIDSVLKQSFPNFEFIIVDDGSTDSTVSYIEKYNDPRIRLIKNKHDYIDSLNRGINEARGRYIARMDADDVMMPDRLLTQYDYMEGHQNIDFCGSWVEFFGNQNHILRTIINHKEIKSNLLLHSSLVHPSVMFRDSVYKNNKNLYSYGYPCAEDYKLWVDLIKANFRCANIPMVLLRYRRSNKQQTVVNYKASLTSGKKIQLEYIDYFLGNMAEKEEGYVDFFNSLIDLSNKNTINIDQLKNIIYQIQATQ
ncbi:MAG: glycosyltransferase [Bacteroidales bacterium]|nr:glycosyltransferase [Bacteroidales bacterium]